jgi:hypothetical protein
VVRIGPGEKEAAGRRLLNSNLIMLDQVAINSGFGFRRYVLKPMPADRQGLELFPFRLNRNGALDF